MYTCNDFNIYALQYLFIHVQVSTCTVGGIAVVRSYVAASTTEESRSWGLAGSSGSQAVGFMVGPGME